MATDGVERAVVSLAGRWKITITAPADFAGNRVFLRFEGVTGTARIWVNGVPAGEHHGGSQPLGLEEQVCPKVFYDFQAPLGGFGFSRESYHYLRALHLLVQDFASELAPAFPVLPTRIPAEPKGAATLRSIVRSLLKWATVQPLSVIRDSGQAPAYCFVASEGVPPEYVFDNGTSGQIETECGKVVRESAGTRVSGLTPGTGCLMTIGAPDGPVGIVTLTNQQSRLYWKAALAGSERAFLAGADLQFGEDTVIADSIGAPQFTLAVYPSVNLQSPAADTRSDQDGVFTRYQVKVPPQAHRRSNARGGAG